MKKRGLDLFPRPSLSNLAEVFHELRDFFRPTRDRWRDGPRYGGGRSYYETIAEEEENRPLHEENGNTRISFEDSTTNRAVNGPEEAAHNDW